MLFLKTATRHKSTKRRTRNHGSEPAAVLLASARARQRRNFEDTGKRPGSRTRAVGE